MTKKPAAVYNKAMKAFAGKYLKYIILAAAAAAIVYGCLNGEIMAVFQKASQICLECIGIG